MRARASRPGSGRADAFEQVSRAVGQFLGGEQQADRMRLPMSFGSAMLRGPRSPVKEARWCRRQTSPDRERPRARGRGLVRASTRARPGGTRTTSSAASSTSRATCASPSSASTSPSSHPGSPRMYHGEEDQEASCPRRRGPAPGRGRGAAAPPVGLLPLPALDGARDRGRGEGPCVFIGSARAARARACSIPRDVALKHGAGVREDTSSGAEAYADVSEPAARPTAKAICPGGSRLGRGRQSQQALRRYPMAGRRQAPKPKPKPRRRASKKRQPKRILNVIPSPERDEDWTFRNAQRRT